MAHHSINLINSPFPSLLASLPLCKPGSHTTQNQLKKPERTQKIQVNSSIMGFMSSWLTPSSLFLILNIVIGTIAIISRFASNKRPQQHHQEDHHYPNQQHHQLDRAPSLLDRVTSINFSLYKFPSNNWDTHHRHLQVQPTAEHEHASPVDPNLPPPLARVPSFLERVTSVNFSLFKFQSPNSDSDHVEPDHANRVDPDDRAPLSRTPSLLDRVKSNLSSLYRSDSNSWQNPEHEIDSEPEHDEDQHIHVERSKSESRTRAAMVLPEKMKKSASEKSGMHRKSSQEEDGEKEEEEETEAVGRRRPQTAKIEKTVSFGESGDVDAKADDFINRFKQQLKLQRLDSLLRLRKGI